MKASAEAVAQKIGGLQVTIARKVGEQDKLYGSVTNKDIADALVKMGVELDRHSIDLAEPIKALGTFDVPAKLHSSVVANIKVWVVAE
jgi:large subunit ribosomal protein L9